MRATFRRIYLRFKEAPTFTFIALCFKARRSWMDKDHLRCECIHLSAFPLSEFPKVIPEICCCCRILKVIQSPLQHDLSIFFNPNSQYVAAFLKNLNPNSVTAIVGMYTQFLSNSTGEECAGYKISALKTSEILHFLLYSSQAPRQVSPKLI